MQTLELATDKPIYPISVLAEVLQCHQRTLRIYDEEGILKPKRSTKGRRLYSHDDIQRGKFIQYLTKSLGINLAGIKVIFELLKEMRIGKENRYEVLRNIVDNTVFSFEQQAENKIKLSRRGRKKDVR